MTFAFLGSVTKPSSEAIVVGNFVYIDGGEYSTYNDGEVDFEYSNTLLSIDLSKNWTNSTLAIHSTTKPTSVPSLVYPGLWYDEDTNLLYTGFAGRTSVFNTSELDPWPMGIWTFEPDGLGSGTWGTALDSSASVFDTITRPYTAAIAHGNRVGYALGGSVTWQTAPDAVKDTSAIVNIDGMLRFDMATQELTNVTVEGPRFHNGHVQYAEMIYVPNFGPKGIFVVLGGVTKNPETDLLDWTTVTVFDPSEKWYDQDTTGNTPQGRKEFCAAGLASDNSTYEIFVYAGWGGDLGTKSVQFDQIYILTLPAFHWIKVDYSPTGTRHALTCHAVGGSQILTIGGLNSASTDSSARIYEGPFNDKDKYTQGLAVFDLSTLEWKNEYTTNANQYTQSDLVRTYYAQNNRNPSFNSTQLKAVFDTTNFTNTASTRTSSGAFPSTSTNADDKQSHHLSTSAIAGITVGSIVAVLILSGGLTLYCCARKRRKQRNMHIQQSNPWAMHDPPQELPNELVAELPRDQNHRIWELQGGHNTMSHEKDGDAVIAELPGEQVERRRSGRR